MRTFLNKTALGVVIIATLFACTKDVKDSQANSQADILSLDNVKAAQKASEPKPEKKPTLTFSQNPVIATVGKPVTISYTASDPNITDPAVNAAIGCGRITIYQLIGTEWKEVAVGYAPTVSFDLIPETATDCAYKFRAGYAPGAGKNGATCKDKDGIEIKFSGVGYETQPEVCVDVQECVETFTIKGDVVEAKPVEGGQYEFKIEYILTSPVDVPNVWFQGGTTAGGKEGSSISELGDMVVVRHENNKNYVLAWEGDLKACTPTRVWFKYRRNFSCPASAEEVTGQWSASITGTDNKYYLAPLTFSCPQ